MQLFHIPTSEESLSCVLRVVVVVVYDFVQMYSGPGWKCCLDPKFCSSHRPSEQLSVLACYSTCGESDALLPTRSSVLRLPEDFLLYVCVTK